MTPDELKRHLCNLETALHCRSGRRDGKALERLLHGAFVEIGRSGRLYGREEILQLLDSEAAIRVHSQNFVMTELSDNIMLLTYRSARIDESGQLFRHALRSSIWQRTADGWQLRFHQGTPTDEFKSRQS